MDIEITGTIVILYALIMIWVMSLARGKRWSDLAGIGALSCAATYAVWIGVVPAWSLAAYLEPLSETIELLLLVGLVVLLFVYGLTKFSPTAGAVGLFVGLILAITLKALLEPSYAGWLVRSPMPGWAVFWVGLVIVPITFVLANYQSRYMVLGGLALYAVVLVIWLSLGASLPYLVSCGIGHEVPVWCCSNCPIRRWMPW